MGVGIAGITDLLLVGIRKCGRIGEGCVTGGPEKNVDNINIFSAELQVVFVDLTVVFFGPVICGSGGCDCDSVASSDVRVRGWVS